MREGREQEGESRREGGEGAGGREQEGGGRRKGEGGREGTMSVLGHE